MTPRRTRPTWPWIALCVLMLAFGVAGGVLLDRLALLAALPADAIPSGAQADFRLIAQAWNVIRDNYVRRDGLQPDQLTYGAISGMTDALGDIGHSRFLTPSMVREQRQMSEGNFQGIGAEVQMQDGHVVIVAPFDGSPAQEAGLMPGDMIMGVDGQDTEGQSLEEVVSRILGPAGTKVTLTVLDPETGRTREVTLTRARIQLQPVSWHILPGTQTVHVRISEFSRGATDDLRAALEQARGQGAASVLLDLRSNPGGLLDEAVGVASQFLSDGVVVQQKNAAGEVKSLAVKPGGAATDLPVVLLVDGGTASAAEIVAAALQDAGRAQLVGETTYGTGTVLQRFALADGSALLLAVEEWLSRDGRTIWHQGVEPDVAVSLETDAQPLLPSGEEGLTADQLRSAADAQVLKALELLSGGGTGEAGG